MSQFYTNNSSGGGGSGDVSGPSSSVIGNVAAYSSTDGKSINDLGLGAMGGVIIRDIDFMATGLTLVYTVPSVGMPNRVFIPTKVIFNYTTSDGYISPPTVSVGTTASAPDYNDIVPENPVDIPYADNSLQFELAGLSAIASSGSEIQLNISAPATATTLIGNITLVGVFS
jgi:hypothetical protein